MKLSSFAKYSWALLVYNVAVVLWGAFVRATGSGAGCGGHWPLCNGQVVPRSPQLETIVEFTHRVTSGISVAAIVILIVLAYRLYPKGHPVRLGASLSMFFIVTEALVGAMLVLFNWVVQNALAIPTSIHLVNTFFLLASISLTAWWASGGKKISLHDQGRVLWELILGLVGVLVLGVSGAVTALGDTLFPSSSLAAGISQDFSSGASFLIRLRVFHPLIAAMVGLYLILLAVGLGDWRESKEMKWFAWALGGLFVLQLSAGILNVLLLAPTWMQIVHLFLADSVWITLVLLSAATLTASPREVKAETKKLNTAASKQKPV